jgi:hypothetical protein
MKSKIILVNWIISWFGLTIDTEHSPMWASMVAISWFLISGWLFLRAEKRGDYKEIEKRFKIDEL